MRMDYETYSLERVGEHVLIVMMDRSEVRNAKNTKMGLEQIEIFQGLYRDTEGVRAVIYTGRGDKAFCAGGDLKERNGMTNHDWQVQHRIFERRAKEIVMTGLPFTAQEACDWGLVNKVCEPEKLMEETIATAERIANNAPLSIRAAKRSTSIATQVDRMSGYQFELQAYNRLVGTDDRLEGVAAFNEKRKAQFKGS